MALRTSPPNNIKALLDKKGLTSTWLAKRVGTSGPHMSRLIHGQSPLKIKWMLKISAALKVPTSKIAGVDMDSSFTRKADDALLGAIMGWILEAADDYKHKLSREELTKLTAFIYKEAVDQRLSFPETRYLVINSVRVKKLFHKP